MKAHHDKELIKLIEETIHKCTKEKDIAIIHEKLTKVLTIVEIMKESSSKMETNINQLSEFWQTNKNSIKIIPELKTFKDRFDGSVRTIVVTSGVIATLISLICQFLVPIIKLRLGF